MLFIESGNSFTAVRANNLSTGMTVTSPKRGVGLIGDKSGDVKKDICAFSQKGRLDGSLGLFQTGKFSLSWSYL